MKFESMPYEKPEEQKKEKEEENFESFKEKMRGLQEAESKRELKTAHFVDTKGNSSVDMDKLTEADYEMWERLQEGDLSVRDVTEYRDGIDYKTERDRYGFAEFIINKFEHVRLGEELRKMREEDKLNK